MSSLRFLILTACILFLDPLCHAVMPREPETASAGSWLAIHGGVSGLFDSETIPALALEYRSGRAIWAGLQPWIGGGWATDGAVFAGGGVLRTWKTGIRGAITAGFGPAYYDRHEGLDLGSQLEFYSFIEAGWDLSPRRRVFLRLAHISNGNLGDKNPGTELLSVGYGVRLP